MVNHGREKRERRERGEARVTSGIQGLWWTARTSNTVNSGRYIGFPLSRKATNPAAFCG
jgi:hypothetical protein